MSILVLIRHGQSTFNEQNLFTGWLDPPLSPTGIKEAYKARDLLKNLNFDAAFCSSLKRAKETLNIIITTNKIKYLKEDEALNERDYGDLSGKNKDKLRLSLGIKQIEDWRRSYLSAPPNGESLKDTYERVIPYYKKQIEPLLRKGQTVLVCAHGNSLRALIKELDGISDEDIVNTEIPTAVPIVYEFDEENRLIKKTILSG